MCRNLASGRRVEVAWRARAGLGPWTRALGFPGRKPGAITSRRPVALTRELSQLVRRQVVILDLAGSIPAAPSGGATRPRRRGRRSGAGALDVLSALKDGDSYYTAGAVRRRVPASRRGAGTSPGLTCAPQAFSVSARPAATCLPRVLMLAIRLDAPTGTFGRARTRRRAVAVGEPALRCFPDVCGSALKWRCARGADEVCH